MADVCNRLGIIFYFISFQFFPAPAGAVCAHLVVVFFLLHSLPVQILEKIAQQPIERKRIEKNNVADAKKDKMMKKKSAYRPNTFTCTEAYTLTQPSAHMYECDDSNTLRKI